MRDPEPGRPGSTRSSLRFASLRARTGCAACGVFLSSRSPAHLPWLVGARPAGHTAGLAMFDPQRPSAELLITAYARGIFPMVDPHTHEIEWFSPDPRGIFPLEGFHVPRRLARTARAARFEIRTNTAFESVMRQCAAPRARRPQTWIDERLIAAYVDLHRRGAAHSIEAWREDELVGGLYGVHLGGAFFGESMFSRPERGGTDASKICLVRLVELLRERGFTLLDTQLSNPHLEQFHCLEIPRAQYLQILQRALRRPARWPEAHVLSPAMRA